MKNPDCIFCSIVAGKIPSVKLYEDNDVLAFLDIGPIIKGHTLVIPKTHCDPLMAVPAELLTKIMTVVQKVAQAQITALKAEGFNLHQSNGKVAGQVVPHVHFHVIPRFAADGHHWNWVAGKYENNDEMQALGRTLRGLLQPVKTPRIMTWK